MEKINQKEFYRDFRVVVSGSCPRTLVGLPLFILLAGEQNVINAIYRRQKCLMDKCTIKLRRGLKIEIYLK